MLQPRDGPVRVTYSHSGGLCEGSLTVLLQTFGRVAGSGVHENGAPDEVLRTIKIKAHSKLDALEKLGKNLKLFTGKLEMSGGLGIGAQLSAARRRARMSKGSHEEHRIKVELLQVIQFSMPV